MTLYTYDGGPIGTMQFLAMSYTFTGKERDPESGLDHTRFRQYSSSLGRWMHPDPAGLAAVRPANPQSWNRYAYAANSPTSVVDPLGLNYCYVGGGPQGGQIVEMESGQCPNGNAASGSTAAAPISGYEIFDAISGQPGAYLSLDMYGNMSFGFSLDLYQFIANLPGVHGLSVSGWTYLVRDLGPVTTASGFLADKIASAEVANWLNANYPGSVDQITSNLNQTLKDFANSGLNMANIFMPKIIWAVVVNYAQQYSLGNDWAEYFYDYFKNLGPALPKNP